MEDLFQEYLQTLDLLKSMEKELQKKVKENNNFRDAQDLRIVRSERRSVENVIDILNNEYVRTNTLIYDPQIMDKIRVRSVGNWAEVPEQYVSYTDRHSWEGESSGLLSALPQEAFENCLRSEMTEREYVCVLAYERGMTQEQIATYLQVTRTTVQSYILRGRKKLASLKGLQIPLWYMSEEKEPQIL